VLGGVWLTGSVTPLPEFAHQCVYPKIEGVGDKRETFIFAVVSYAFSVRSTIKVYIRDEFGDGIMSAIDFSMNIPRESDPKGDRVHIAMSGKFLPYKMC
jgi:hypothetical protein